MAAVAARDSSAQRQLYAVLLHGRRGRRHSYVRVNSSEISRSVQMGRGEEAPFATLIARRELWQRPELGMLRIDAGSAPTRALVGALPPMELPLKTFLPVGDELRVRVRVRARVRSDRARGFRSRSPSGAPSQPHPNPGRQGSFQRSGAITLTIEHSGPDNSVATLIEGLVVDGQRERQGPFRDFELQDARLIELSGASNATGKLRVSLENLTLTNGTGNGLSFGPNYEATVCQLHASELWRDAVSLRGGQSRIRIRELDALSSEGTTGLFLGPTPSPSGRPGSGNGFIDIELEDVRLGSGDVEIEACQGSRVTVRRLTMTRPPFRLLAPDATVRIADSVLQIGVTSDRYNHWTVPHDVQVTGSTLVVSETVGDEGPTVEEDRTLAAAPVRWQVGPGDPDPTADSGHQLTFEGCRFELGRDLEPGDSVYAASSSVNGGANVIRSSTLGSGMRGWFAPECEGCVLMP